MRRFLVTMIMGAALVSGPVAAQEVDKNAVNRQLQGILGGMAGKMSGGGAAGQTQTQLPAAPLLPAAVTRFKRDPRVSKEVEQIFIDGIRAYDTAAATELQRVFSENDIWAALAPGLEQYQLSPTDAADAMAVYLIGGWQTANGIEADPTLAEIAAVRSQMDAVLRAVPDFGKSSDAEKQKMAEGLMLQTMLFEMMTDAVKTDPAATKKVRSDVREGMKATLNIDPLALKMTATGLTTK
jgi:hypothetical protein